VPALGSGTGRLRRFATRAGLHMAIASWTAGTNVAWARGRDGLSTLCHPNNPTWYANDLGVESDTGVRWLHVMFRWLQVMTRTMATGDDDDDDDVDNDTDVDDVEMVTCNIR